MLAACPRPMPPSRESQAAARGSDPAVSPTPPPPAKFQYQASLDGLRALAVLAIIAYHFNYGLGAGRVPLRRPVLHPVGLPDHDAAHHGVATDGSNRAPRVLGPRGARRLLPALLLLLVFVAIITVTAIAPWNRASVRDDGLASLFYVANWRFIAAKESYFELFSAASPLRHMWTLAIEEQFYLVWPLVCYVAMRAGRGSLRILTAVCVVGIVASVTVMAITYQLGRSAPGVLRHRCPRPHDPHRRVSSRSSCRSGRPEAGQAPPAMVSILAFVVMIYAWNVATGTSSRYYHGGSVAYAVLACVVIAGALQPGILHTALAVPRRSRGSDASRTASTCSTGR